MSTEDLESVGRQAREARSKAIEAERRSETAETQAKQAKELAGTIADATTKELKRIEDKVDKGFARIITLLDGNDGDLEQGLRWRVARHEDRIGRVETTLTTYKANGQEISKAWIAVVSAVISALVSGLAVVLAAQFAKGHP